MAPIWADPFLGIVLALVAVATVMDFLIGKQGRRKLKETIGWWWLLTENNSISAFISKEAGRIVATVGNTIGRRHFFLKCALFVLFLNVISAAIVVVVASMSGENLVAIEEVRRNISHPPEVQEQDFAYLSWALFVTSVVPNVILDFVALVCSVLVFLANSRTRNPTIVIPLTVLDIVVVSGLTVMVYETSLASFSGTYRVSASWDSIHYIVMSVALSVVSEPNLSYFWNQLSDIANWKDSRWFLRGTLDLEQGNWDFFIIYPAAKLALLVVALVSVLPTVCHALILFLFFLSKLFKRVLEPITSFVFSRLYNDERSVLTIAALVLGTFAKLVQELWKALA